MSHVLRYPLSRLRTRMRPRRTASRPFPPSSSSTTGSPSGTQGSTSPRPPRSSSGSWTRFSTTTLMSSRWEKHLLKLVGLIIQLDLDSLLSSLLRNNLDCSNGSTLCLTWVDTFDRSYFKLWICWAILTCWTSRTGRPPYSGYKNLSHTD